MAKIALLFVLVGCLLPACYPLDNGLGLTPPLGFNTWYAWWCNINSTIIKEAADAMVDTGLLKLGYNYVNLDDCWAGPRFSNGSIQGDPKGFPDMKGLVDYVHSKGMLFGLYSDAGNLTCGGRPGSLGYEKLDANSYAAWGVDFLKYDNCYNEGIPPIVRDVKMRDALNATGRPIFYSLCEWGVDTPAYWAREVGNMWRTTNDEMNSWIGTLFNLDLQEEYYAYAGPGGWNDPDMLRVGNGVLTDVEGRSQFSLWALVKSPLQIGCDVRVMTPATFATLSNKEVIDVNQDSLGVQGRRVASSISKAARDARNTIIARTLGKHARPKHEVRASQAMMAGRRVMSAGEEAVAALGLSYVIVADCNPQDPAQQWTARPDGGISVKLDGTCLDAYDCSNSTYAPIGMYNCSIGQKNNCGVKNQIWKFASNDTSRPGLIVSAMNKDLCVGAQGTAIQMSTCAWDDPAQLWYIDPKTALMRNSNNKCLAVDDGTEVWAGPLSKGAVAVVLFNRSTSPQDISVTWDQVFDTSVNPAPRSVNVRDLWEHKDLGTMQNGYTAETVPSHGVVMLKLTL
eukprot:TRINITY_DN8202_c0_g1_i3.p1 TRINITY_DN8202_c0_g1~~TRINITY_DN8202_c0_g1_i3.p1  ORF type:complete len:568 (+),score=132.79 TRINITY_DN8202_c0_g1_i3:158-1861(+)